jgi:hypothetical protein
LKFYGGEKSPFFTDFPNEMAELDVIQSRFKMVSSNVIQAVYDVFKSPNLVQDLLKLAFP